MDEIVCGRSAFRYWRCPPQIREMYPELPWSEQGWREVKNAPFVQDVLGSPVDVLRQKGSPHLDSGTRRSTYWSGELEPGVSFDTGMGFSVTSPLMSLFTAARFLDFWDLVMLMYEACGQFAVFELPDSIREEATNRIMEEHESDGDSLPHFSSLDDEPDADRWTCVFAKEGPKSGKPTSLWRRSPLVEHGELLDFAEQMSSRRWGKKFRDAARMVFGVGASPLEAQGAILFGAPTWRGGSGFDNPLLNDWTPLSSSARKLCSKRTCYGDIVLTNPENLKVAIVECQGEMIHGSGAVQASDSERMTALQSMGYSVLLVSHDMLSDGEQFDVIRKTVFQMLGLRPLEKTKREQIAESELRRAIFCDWSKLV